MSEMRREADSRTVGTGEHIIHGEFRAKGDVTDEKDATDQGSGGDALGNMGAGGTDTV
ncbi:MAG: hypothetical protein LHW59_03520 [Candidatus Cloacimonetes bacterium]|nr:hypothetical protein [Candidatus Cloacimonadota bacterium]